MEGWIVLKKYIAMPHQKGWQAILKYIITLGNFSNHRIHNWDAVESHTLENLNRVPQWWYWPIDSNVIGLNRTIFWDNWKIVLLTSATQVSVAWRNLLNYICREPKIRAGYFATYNPHNSQFTQFLHSLWRRANSRYVCFETLCDGQLRFSTQLIILNYLFYAIECLSHGIQIVSSSCI